jgi:predicted DNA-binding transcriptional regulator AlpA
MPSPRKNLYKPLPEQLEQFRLLRVSEVLQILPIGPRTWHRGVKEGRFPKPVRLSAGVVCWRLTDVLELAGSATD